MITICDHRTGDLFDPWEHLGSKRRSLLERSWAGVFRKHLLSDLPVREFANGFAAGHGRPSKDVYAIAGVLVLQQLHDLSDAAMVEALAFNLAWHYALDIRNPPDPTFSNARCATTVEWRWSVGLMSCCSGI